MRARVLSLLLTLALLLPLCAGAETAAQSAADQEMPAVRILLRRLELTDRIDLTLEGLYTATGGAEIAFPRGAEVQLQVRADKIYLYWRGMSVCMGSEAVFTRHSAEEGTENCLRIAPWSAAYPGDLRLTVSGGQIQPVLTIGVEDYLLGVVPYEMSDDFPLEALKAQAVCARTYALAHLDPEKAWDMEDTTNNQVFKGVSGDNRNAERAIRETAGVVGTYKGALAECYYSASNGGQTELVEHVWTGLGDWSYYAMVDDPYDLANPASPVRTARLTRDPGSWPEEFKALAAEAAAKVMRSNRLIGAEDTVRPIALEGASLATPRFEAPSRLMTELVLTVLCDLGEAEERAQITLPVFPGVMDTLGLRLNPRLDNELLTLTEEKDGWTLASRRYGNGVGMSQRGAQYMAQHEGKLFHEILSFYYPGMTLMRVQHGGIALPTLDPQLARTPGPAATPTPRPTLMPVTGALPEGAWLASVEGVAEDSSLNLRAEPSLASQIVMRLYAHQRLMVLETCEDPAWVHVRTDSAEGYVMAEFLQRVEE